MQNSEGRKQGKEGRKSDFIINEQGFSVDGIDLTIFQEGRDKVLSTAT